MASNLIDKKIPDYSAPSLTREALVKHYKYGLRDIQFSEDEEQSIWLAADAGAYQNLKKTLTFGLFGNKQEDQLGEGVIEGYDVKPEETSKHGYKVDRLFKQKSSSPAICLKWYDRENFFVVGYENGHIGWYTYNRGSNPDQIVEAFIAKVHNKRVLDIDVDTNTKLIYSISKGSKLRIYDYQNKIIINGTKF